MTYSEWHRRGENLVQAVLGVPLTMLPDHYQREFSDWYRELPVSPFVAIASLIQALARKGDLERIALSRLSEVNLLEERMIEE